MKPEDRIPEEDCRARLYTFLDTIKKDLSFEPEIQYPIKDGNKNIFADLVLWDCEKEKPFLVIEVKKPKLGRSNLLNEKSFDQVLKYAKLLDVPYFMLSDCTFTIIFKRDGTSAKPLRQYFRKDTLNYSLWKNIIKSLLSGDISSLPESDELAPEAEKNLIGIARHIAWKMLAPENKSIKVDNELLNRKSGEIYEMWMKEMFGRNIVKKMRMKN
ncbi:MAG: type I restriction enzyme HsdR N-terminal domain-containing protein [Euryarchaeota archaeon]|nr:type I restriction enzyme HsdR N-terminal domain-containing protein [Euryarchaeota archaeon]